MQQWKCEVRDGMRIDWDAPIEMNDGVVLRADVFRPVPEGRYPVTLGTVGLNGISYYAMNPSHVAPPEPWHLAALCIWEGSSDYYRELAHPHDRPPEIFSGVNTLHFGGAMQPYLLLPVIPAG